MKKLLPLFLATLAGCITPALEHRPENRNDGPRLEPADPAILGRRELHAAILVTGGVFDSELAAPRDVLRRTPGEGRPGMRTFTIAANHAAIITRGGESLVPDYAFDDAPRIDVLVIPSAGHAAKVTTEDEGLLAFLRAQHARGDYVLALGDGVHLLARAGLLDGAQATIDPPRRATLRRAHPAIRVREGVRLVHDGKSITAVGGANSVEPALYLCERLYGRDVARALAKEAFVDWDLRRVPALTPR